MQLTFTGNNPSSPQNNNRMDGYTYDSAGNLLNDGTHQYFYDAEGHLIQVDGSSGYCSSGTGTAATACYFYDAEGHRVRNTGVADCAGHSGLAGGMGYTYDLSGRWVTAVATDAANEGPCEYEVYAGNRHLFHSKSLNSYSHTDWLGTERARICAPSSSCGGYNQDLCTSLPFGDGLSCTFTLSGDYTSHDHFTGKERDTETGLDNFGARFDASSFGRWMSPDAINLTDERVQNPANTLNKYAYGGNNPLKYVDPDGRDITLFYSNEGPGGHMILYAYDTSNSNSAVHSFGPESHGAAARAAELFSIPVTGKNAYGFEDIKSPDDLRQHYTSFTIQTSPEETEKAIQIIKQMTAGNYTTYFHNCTTTCADILRKLKLHTWGEIVPQALFYNFASEHGNDKIPYPAHHGTDYGKPRSGYDAFRLLFLSLQRCHTENAKWKENGKDTGTTTITVCN